MTKSNFMDMVSSGVVKIAPKTILFGDKGAGKTTLAAAFPKALFIQTEKGDGILDLQRMPFVKTYDQLKDQLYKIGGAIKDGDFPFKTLVLDSLTALEPLICEEAVRRNPENKKNGEPCTSIEDYGYGRGYQYVAEIWQELMKVFDRLQANDLPIVLICHEQIQKRKDVVDDDYDQASLALFKRTVADLTAWADIVCYIRPQMTLATKTDNKNETKRARGQGYRELWFGDNPAIVCKTRYPIPTHIENLKKVEDMVAPFLEHIPFYKEGEK